MTLTDQYKRQLVWRDWKSALAACPISPGQRILDLGCGPGDTSFLLQEKGTRVTGVDGDPALLKAAMERYPDIDFLLKDLKTLDLNLAEYDGLWCSFTAAYFTDFSEIFSAWKKFLKPKSWVCIIEMDDLLNHSPLPSERQGQITEFYEKALANRGYDFRSGRRIQDVLENNGLNVTKSELNDDELSFQGAASPNVLRAWEERLDRMAGLKRFFGDDYGAFRLDFLNCLQDPAHRSNCRVVCCVGLRDSS